MQFRLTLPYESSTRILPYSQIRIRETLLDGNERMSNSSKRKDKLALNRLNISRSTGNLSMTSLTNARSKERERGEERSRDNKEGRKSRDATAGRRNDRYMKTMTPLEQTKDKDVIIVNDVRRFMKLYYFKQLSPSRLPNC